METQSRWVPGVGGGACKWNHVGGLVWPPLVTYGAAAVAVETVQARDRAHSQLSGTGSWAPHVHSVSTAVPETRRSARG